MTSEPERTGLEKFLGLVRASGLVAMDRLDDAYSTYCRSIGSRSRDDVAIDGFCEHLIAARLLTYWQCSRLRDGRWRGFLIDRYKLLGHLRYGTHESFYLAEDMQSKTQVEMTARHASYNNQDDGGGPFKTSTDGPYQYRVKPIADG